MRVADVTALIVAASTIARASAAAQDTRQGDQRLRVAIVAFVNQTGDASLNAVSVRIEEAASAIAGQVPRAVLVRASTTAGVRATDPLTTIATRTQARTIIRGTISKTGDQVQLDAIAVNPSDGKTIHHLPVERAAASDPAPAIQRLASRIAGMLAVHSDPTRTMPHLYSVPTLEAYQLKKRADSLFNVGRPAEALPLVYEAVQLDSMNVEPLLLAVAIHNNAGRVAVGDSLLKVLEAPSDVVRPFTCKEVTMRSRICRSAAWAFLLCIAGSGCGSDAPSADGTPAAAARSRDDDRAAVESAVRTHWTAINGGDTATVGAQHTADLTIIMTEVSDRFAIPSPTADSLFPSLLTDKPQYVVEDLQIQLFGDVGVATLYLSGGVVLANGRLDSRRRRVTEIWVRQSDGVWKEAHHHDSVFSSL